MIQVSLSQVAAKLASTLGRREGVRVTVGGAHAHTDGSVINIPSMFPPGTSLTKDQLSLLMGYVDHETSHVRDTDFKAWQRWAKIGPFSRHVMNVLEDVRVEKKFITRYPGAQTDLDRVCEHLEKNTRITHLVTPEDSKELTLERGVSLMYQETYYLRGRPQVFKDTLADYPQARRLIALVQSLEKCGSTEEVGQLTRKVVIELAKICKHTQSSKEESGGQEQPCESGEDSPSGKSSGSDEHSESGESPKSGKSGQSSPAADVLGAGEATGELDGFSEEEKAKALAVLESLDKSGKLQELLEQIAAGEAAEDSRIRVKGSRNVGTLVLPPKTTKDDKIFCPSDEDWNGYQVTKGGLSNEIRALKKGVHIYLMSRGERVWERGLEDGHLDSDALWKIRAGETKRLFKSRRTTSIVNTAVCLMIDLSSSMDRELTKTAAVLVSEVLLGVPNLKVMIAGFRCPNMFFGYAEDMAHGRMTPLEFPLFKGFEDKGRVVKNRIGALRTSGSTPLGEAYVYGYEALMNRKEERKVLWVITDGDPAVTTGNPGHNEYLLMSRVHRKAKKRGVEILGMEVDTPREVLKDYSDVTLRIQNMQQLPAAVLDTVKVLIKTRFS